MKPGKDHYMFHLCQDRSESWSELSIIPEQSDQPSTTSPAPIRTRPPSPALHGEFRSSSSSSNFILYPLLYLSLHSGVWSGCQRKHFQQYSFLPQTSVEEGGGVNAEYQFRMCWLYSILIPPFDPVLLALSWHHSVYRSRSGWIFSSPGDCYSLSIQDYSRIPYIYP